MRFSSEPLPSFPSLPPSHSCARVPRRTCSSRLAQRANLRSRRTRANDSPLQTEEETPTAEDRAEDTEDSRVEEEDVSFRYRRRRRSGAVADRLCMRARRRRTGRIWRRRLRLYVSSRHGFSTSDADATFARRRRTAGRTGRLRRTVLGRLRLGSPLRRPAGRTGRLRAFFLSLSSTDRALNFVCRELPSLEATEDSRAATKCAQERLSEILFVRQVPSVVRSPLPFSRSSADPSRAVPLVLVLLRVPSPQNCPPPPYH